MSKSVFPSKRSFIGVGCLYVKRTPGHLLSHFDQHAAGVRHRSTFIDLRLTTSKRGADEVGADLSVAAKLAADAGGFAAAADDGEVGGAR